MSGIACLDKKEDVNMIWMMTLDCDVTCWIFLMCFALSDKGHKICNVANDRWLNLDGLGI